MFINLHYKILKPHVLYVIDLTLGYLYFKYSIVIIRSLLEAKIV